MEQREDANGKIGVDFTATNHEEVRLWVQNLAGAQEIVATPARLYLPVGSVHMVTAGPGDTIWFDPELPGPNAFSITRT